MISTNSHFNEVRESSGFALLITLITLSGVLLIMVSLIDLSLQQLGLAVDSRDSEIAFQAANAGIECVQRTRRVEADDIEAGNSITFACFNTTSSVSRSSLTPVTVGNSGDGDVYRYRTQINWPASANRCTEVDMVTLVSDIDATTGVRAVDLDEIFPGHTGSKTCPPGARCTIAISRGYNAPCTALSESNVLRREVLLEF